MKQITKWVSALTLCGISLIGSAALAQADFRIGFISDGSTEAIKLQEMVYREVSTLLGSEVDIEKTSYVGKPTPQSLNELAEEAYQDTSIDVVVAPGFLGSNYLFRKGRFPKPTILSQVVDPGASESQADTLRSNLYWLSQRQDTHQTLKIIQDTLNPKHITLLLAVNLEHLGASVVDDLIERGKNIGIIIEVVEFNPDKPASAQIAKGAELVMLPPLSHDLSTKVIGDLSAHNTPVYTLAGRRIVEQGAMMTDRSDADFKQIARRMALDLYSLYLNEPIPLGPRWLEMKHELILNMGVAVELGIDLPIDVLSAATLVGEMPGGLEAIELVDVVAWVVDKNTSLAQSNRSVRIADEDVIQTHSALLPQLNANFKHERDDNSGASALAGNPVHDTQASLTLSQNVYSVNKKTSYERSQLAQKATQHEYSAVEQNLVLQAINGYLNVLSTQSAINTGTENLRLSRNTLSLSNKRQRFGSGTLADVYTSQSSIATAESALLSTRIQSFEIRRALIELSNTRFDENALFASVDVSNELFSLTHELLLPSLETIGGIRHLANTSAEVAKEVDPDLLASSLTLDSSELQLKAAEKNRFSPEVSISGQTYQFLDSGDSSNGTDLDGVNDWSVSLNVSIPIWNSGNRASLARQASEQKLNAELAHIATRNSLDTAVRNSVFSIAKAWRNIKLGRIELESSQKGLEIDQAAYASGAITITTLQSSQNTYITALEGVAEDKYQYLNALATWQRRMAAMPALMQKTQYEQWAEVFRVRLNANH